MRIRAGRGRFRARALRWGAALAVVVACAAAAEARAETKSAAEARVASIVVDGEDWMKSSTDERQAFLIGVANMIIAEGAYAKRHQLAMPPVSDRIVAGVAQMKFVDIEGRITHWYEANPAQRSMPVMGVVWQDIAGQKPAGGKAQ